ncbi:M18 family aminopeptidase [Agilicoccus flavus]|uniref:M18 family aminopeptidase n=1 Tax=Agilicoccus flavus TaxID=2775968 RepID=UPI001CF6E0EF|nr:M18 family aminopeptidase [Agilicoccus flavus]
MATHPGPDDVATPEQLEHARGLCAFVDASPSPFHAVEEVARRLGEAGFRRVEESQAWPREPGRYVTVREGSLFAWASTPRTAADPAAPFRVVGGHTDSPNLRIKPQPDVTRLGWDQLGVEVYGGPLLTTWLDRDLGLSGRVAVRDPAAPGGFSTRLVLVDEPVLRVANLAIHLDRSVADEGVRLNPQQHLAPIWGATGDAPSFATFLARRLGLGDTDVLGWDVMTHDLTPSGRLGRVGDLLAVPRLDNLATCYAGTAALLHAVADAEAADAGHVPALVLFDHEEIGSTTNRGGFSTFLPAALERSVLARGGGRQEYWRALAGSLVCSADMAHAVHPNYAERYEPQHTLTVNTGPVLKVNAKGRYASDAPGTAAFALACEQAGVPMQTFVSRTDLPCGSTIGPMSAALTGAVTVDVGSPMLSMHSARELTGVRDPGLYVAALTRVLAPRA